MFDGATYDADKDGKRLTSQLERVANLMSDGRWRSLQAITAIVEGSSVAGISARLRDLRKPKFGGYLVEKKRVEGKNGLWVYRLLLEPGVPNPGPERLTNSDMTEALETLRTLYKHIPFDRQHAIIKLGRWLDANTTQ